MKPYQAIALFSIGTLLMMALYRQELLLFALMSLSALLSLAVDGWKRAKSFIVAMIVGGACENIAVMLGGWSYSYAHYLYAPLWLPIGWGMSMVLLEEAFTKEAHKPQFSKGAVALAFGGSIITGIMAQSELSVLAGFIVFTIGVVLSGYYNRSELTAGFMAAIFGTIMETANIIVGNWHYSSAMFGTPLWLPLCWFNAFLIMRRVAS